MEPASFTLFETAIGHCTLAWRGELVTGIYLPDTSEAVTRARAQRLFGAGSETAVPPQMQPYLALVVAMLRGDAVAVEDVLAVPLDMRGVPAFHQRVYDIALRIPFGQTLTYGQIATQLGEPGAARAVGQALGRNPFAPLVPCHRVLAAGDKPGGFSARGGVNTKFRMLAIEGALQQTPDLFD